MKSKKGSHQPWLGKKSKWEKEKIEETWKDGKIFWGMIRELLGNMKKEEEEAYI